MHMYMVFTAYVYILVNHLYIDNNLYKVKYQITVESHYNEIAISQCLSIVKYFASPSKSCILLYTFNIVNIRYIYLEYIRIPN